MSLARLRSSLSEMRAGESPVQQIVTERQFRRLKSLLDERTGHAVVGGNTAATSIEPPIVVDPDPDSELMRGEIFGPILPVLGVRSLSDAIDFINAREKPLAAYIFSRSKATQQRVFEDVPSGGATANHTLMHVLAPQLPFGGVGESGIGAYHGGGGWGACGPRKAPLVVRR